LDFLSLQFGGLALTALVAFHAVANARWRQAVIALASAVYVGSFADDPQQLTGLVLFLALGYGLVQLGRAKPGSTVFGLAVFTLIALFAWLKRYSALAPLPQPPSIWITVGLSYVLFRVLQLAVDELQAEPGRPPVGPLAYFLFTCSLFTFVSGPIQRYDDHRAQLSKLGDFSLDSATAYAASSRIANGLLKVALISTALNALHLWVLKQTNVPASAAFGAACLVWLLFLYANFSGSIDVVLGLGALFGFALPENFVRPFAAGNLLEFWNGWHITLSQWFKFYVFNPILKFLGRWLKTPSSLMWGGVLGYGITFFLMGLWHGTTSAYVIYGALLGAGVAVTKLYESLMTRRLTKKGLTALRARPIYAAAAHGFTIAYFALTLSLWWREPGKAMPWVGGLFAAAALVIAARAVWMVGSRFTFKGVRAGGPLSQLWLGARAFTLAAIAFDTSFHVPELIYRGF
jgi:alginate O-acetyltransferase complex protein AlgI